MLTRVIREHELEFHSLFTARPHVFVSKTNPLASRPSITLDVDDHMEIGYLLHKRTVPSRFALSYIEALRRHTVGD